MGDMGDMYRAWDEQKKKAKTDRQAASTESLLYAGIKFESKNMGNHLIINHEKGVFDFWPSTGKFKKRGSGKYCNGIKKLLKTLGVEQ